MNLTDKKKKKMVWIGLDFCISLCFANCLTHSLSGKDIF